MKSNIMPKLDFESTDKYANAKKDLLQFIDSFNKLTPQQKERLALEIFGPKAVSDVINFMSSNNSLQS